MVTLQSSNRKIEIHSSTSRAYWYVWLASEIIWQQTHGLFGGKPSIFLGLLIIAPIHALAYSSWYTTVSTYYHSGRLS